ncbi:MAG: hypothetical protein ABJK64_07945 [Paraglaciecola sp.]|uniref:hypothetical protein n=1 Tax=Paraglaciecola sp. TaxID=1920173 RepID=UPI0032983972
MMLISLYWLITDEVENTKAIAVTKNTSPIEDSVLNDLKIYKDIDPNNIKNNNLEVGSDKSNQTVVIDKAGQSVSEIEKASITHAFEDVFGSVARKDWDSLVNITELFDIEGLEDGPLLTFALVKAVSNGAPWTVLLDLLNQGAELNSDVLFASVTRQDVIIIKAFVEYGMDLHQQDTHGRGALYYSLFNLHERNMFDYLIANGVSNESNNPEQNLITRVLTGCNSSVDVSYYIQRLISLGENILPTNRKQYIDLTLNDALCVNSISTYFSDTRKD